MAAMILIAVAVVVQQALILAARAIGDGQPITLAGCPDRCGDVSIPYPFGMAPGCFLDGFEVTCNRTFDPPRAFLAWGSPDSPFQGNADGYYLSDNDSVTLKDYWSLPVELVDVTLSRGEARAYGAVTTDCAATNGTYHEFRRQLTVLSGSPFVFSASRNVLTGVGWDMEAQLTTSLASTGYRLNCASRLMFPETAENGSCSGMGCCEANVTAGLRIASVTFAHKKNVFWSSNPCSYGMIVQKNWYNFTKEDLYGNQTLSRKHPRGVPFVLDFAIANVSCPAQGQPPLDNYACRSSNSFCVNATSSPGYICKCSDHYDGNPYIADGCQGLIVNHLYLPLLNIDTTIYLHTYNIDRLTADHDAQTLTSANSEDNFLSFGTCTRARVMGSARTGREVMTVRANLA